MNQVTIKGKSFNLIGENAPIGTNITFKAKDINDKDWNLLDLKGRKIISIFPSITTRICDWQTLEISRIASQHPEINIISISTDTVETIKEWCHAKGLDNLIVVSDLAYGEFGKKTNLLIDSKLVNIFMHRDVLARGFILLDENNIIIDQAINSETGTEPDFDKLNSWI